MATRNRDGFTHAFPRSERAQEAQLAAAGPVIGVAAGRIPFSAMREGVGDGQDRQHCDGRDRA